MNDTAAPGFESVVGRDVRVAYDAPSPARANGAGAAVPQLFDVDLLQLYARSRKASMGAVAALSSVVALSSLTWLPLPQVAGWYALMAILMASQYALASQFLMVVHPSHAIVAWRGKFAIAELLHGALWASILIMLQTAEDANARTFVFLVLLLAAAMAAMIASAFPLAVYAGLLPLTFSIVTLLYPISGFTSILLTLFAIVAQFYFIYLAHRLHWTSLNTLRFQAEKDLLISELETAKLGAEEAARRAEEANLAKSRFLATMSHELRTPLNAILGFSEVMKSEVFGPHQNPAYREYSHDIHASGQHLLMLINEILDLSRVEAGRYELQEEAITLAHIVEECRHLLALRARKRNLLIDEAIAPWLPQIWGDERAIRQIVLNLLSNAIKFTVAGGHIAIKVGWTADGGQYVSIKDTGPGIPEEEIEMVQASFGRGSLAQKNADEGSGLGLPIVKGLVELHDGHFSLRSKVGEGTEVIVIFPPERMLNDGSRRPAVDVAEVKRASEGAARAAVRDRATPLRPGNVTSAA